MESSTGFFGQFKYVFKGVARPRFFNRLSNQSNFCTIAYAIVMAIVSAVIFWGIIYLRCIGSNGLISQMQNMMKKIPQFTYSSGLMQFEESTYFKDEDRNIYYVFDSTIMNGDRKEALDKVQIMVDWVNGVQIYTFNGQSITHIKALGGHDTIRYSDLFKILKIPPTFSSKDTDSIIQQKFLTVFLIIAGVSIIPFTLKAIVLGLFFGLIGFGIVKIIKQPYTYKELFKISIFITGFTTLIRSAINASPIKPPSLVLNIAFVLIVGVYLFFALAGSTEEAGPASTIVFNKPSSKKLSGEIEPPDPFARKTYSSADYTQRVSAAPTSTSTMFTAKTTTSSNTYATDSSSSPVFATNAPVTSFAEATQSSESYSDNTYASQETASYETSYDNSYAENTTYADNSYAESTAYADNSYAENTAYADNSYADNTYSDNSVYAGSTTYTENTSYVEPEPEPEPASAVIKSDIGTFGGIGTSSGSKKKKDKWARPITAPDAYNGLYYSGSDEEESYESNYGSGTLLDRGGLYGKTIGGVSSENPFSSVLAGTKPQSTSTFTSAYTDEPVAPSSGSTTFTSSTGYSGNSYGGSLYTNHTSTGSETSHVSFTTKEGNTPFNSGGFYLSTPPRGGSSTPKNNTIKTKDGKTINRYSDDDFAAWEREAYADEFNKPRGGFGNNIF